MNYQLGIRGTRLFNISYIIEFCWATTENSDQNSSGIQLDVVTLNLTSVSCWRWLGSSREQSSQIFNFPWAIPVALEVPRDLVPKPASRRPHLFCHCRFTWIIQIYVSVKLGSYSESRIVWVHEGTCSKLRFKLYPPYFYHIDWVLQLTREHPAASSFGGTSLIRYAWVHVLIRVSC